MATFNGNNAYLSWNSVDISGYWTGEISRESSAATEDVTAGAGATHVERNVGLKDNTISFMVVYDDANIATYVSNLAPGTKATLTYGPESNTAGKPKFECSMILTSVSQGQSIAKGLVSFDLSFEGAAAPTSTIEGGSTF